MRNARKDGRLDDSDPASVAMFVLQMRMKAEGWGFMPAVIECSTKGKFPKTVTEKNVEEAVEELHYEPEGSQEEGEW